MKIEIMPGPQTASDGTQIQPRAGRSGELIVSELHGRFYEQTYRGNVYSGGITALTSMTGAPAFTISTLTASCTPIAGLWNPATSGVNAVILQATLGVIITSATNTGCGPFVWATSSGNAAISTGNPPFNRKSFLAPGSSPLKDMSNVLLTGLTSNLVVRWCSALGGGSSNNFSDVDTAVGFSTIYPGSVENIDGAIVVPPGGVLALLATTTPSAHSVVSGLLWEEVPV